MYSWLSTTFLNFPWNMLSSCSQSIIKTNYQVTLWLTKGLDGTPAHKGFSKFQKDNLLKGLKLQAAVPSFSPEILLCQLCVHNFWHCHGNHHIPRSVKKSNFFLFNLQKFAICSLHKHSGLFLCYLLLFLVNDFF